MTSTSGAPTAHQERSLRVSILNKQEKVRAMFAKALGLLAGHRRPRRKHQPRCALQEAARRGQEPPRSLVRRARHARLASSSPTVCAEEKPKLDKSSWESNEPERDRPPRRVLRLGETCPCRSDQCRSLVFRPQRGGAYARPAFKHTIDELWGRAARIGTHRGSQ